MSQPHKVQLTVGPSHLFILPAVPAAAACRPTLLLLITLYIMSTTLMSTRFCKILAKNDSKEEQFAIALQRLLVILQYTVNRDAICITHQRGAGAKHAGNIEC